MQYTAGRARPPAMSNNWQCLAAQFYAYLFSSQSAIGLTHK